MSKNTSARPSEKRQECVAYTAVPLGGQQPDYEEEENSWVSCGESCLLAILPCLLFIQFGVAFLSDSPPQMHWMVVNFGILCFIATALMFRRAFSEPESLVALVPEVLIDIILGLILFEKTDVAAIIMFASILCMGFVAIVKMAVTKSADDESDEDGNDLKQPLV